VSRIKKSSPTSAASCPGQPSQPSQAAQGSLNNSSGTAASKLTSASASNSAAGKPKQKLNQESDRIKFAGRVVPGWTDPKHVPPLSLLLFDILFQCKQDSDAELDRIAKPFFPKILFRFGSLNFVSHKSQN
jgi:hypothetical protein